MWKKMCCAGMFIAAGICLGGEFDFASFIDDVATGKTRLKGMMITMVDPDLQTQKEDLLKLKEFGVNHVRMNTYPGEGATAEEITAIYERLPKDWDSPETMLNYAPWEIGSRALVDRWLPFFEEQGIGVIVNLDAAFSPGLIGRSDTAMWKDPALQRKFADYIIAKAKFFSQSPAVIGYDLINEPVPPGDDAWMDDGVFLGCAWSREKAERDAPDGAAQLANIYNMVIDGIREFDQERLIVVEPGPWGSPAGFEQLLDIRDDPRVIFSFHFYDPTSFTHNNTSAWGSRDSSKIEPLEEYPKTHPNGVVFDRGYMDRIARNAVRFQQEREAKTGRPTIVWIGEFGSVRWLDQESQKRWYRDVLDLFDANQWGWAYFLYSPSHMSWHNFGPMGPEGAEVDLKQYIDQYGAKNQTYFKSLNNKIRPSFQLVIDAL